MLVLRNHKYLLGIALGFICLIVGTSVRAQSLDARSPSAVRTNEITGRIAARDLGDSRFTDHFYSFVGTHGDLVIIIETQNLNGDIDVFTAGALRPLLKVTVYAEVNSPVSKSIYLRQREDLILRIEARTPNDDEGIYHIRFGGSFEPVAGAAETAEESNAKNEEPVAQPRKGRRVSSVGARIKEPTPPTEVAAAPTPEPTPEPSPAPTPETPAAEPKPEAPTVTTPEPVIVRSRPSSRRNRGKTTAEKTEPKPTTETVEPKTGEETSKTEPGAVAEPGESAAKKTTRSKSTATKPAEAATPSETESAQPKTVESKTPESAEKSPEPQGEAKLIIEMLDGSRIERSMRLIRRVILESGQIVVTGTDGNVERIRLARVLRMSIGQ